MLVNRKPRRRRNRRRQPAALARYWAGKRRRRAASGRSRRRAGRTVRVRHVYANPRRRRRSRGGGGGGLVPSGPAGFLSTKFLMDAGAGALGAVAPTLVTDKLLPMIGFPVTGLVRRVVQLAVPTVVLMVGGRRLLGRSAYAFAVGAYAVTVLGLVGDFMGPGTIPAVSGALGRMGRYELSPSRIYGMGKYDRATAALMGR